MNHPHDNPDAPPYTAALCAVQWRTGRKLGRTLYAMTGESADDRDVYLGICDTADIADHIVALHNKTTAP